MKRVAPSHVDRSALSQYHVTALTFSNGVNELNVMDPATGCVVYCTPVIVTTALYARDRLTKAWHEARGRAERWMRRHGFDYDPVTGHYKRKEKA